jgi:hypothetical protein
MVGFLLDMKRIVNPKLNSNLTRKVQSVCVVSKTVECSTDIFKSVIQYTCMFYIMFYTGVSRDLI